MWLDRHLDLGRDYLDPLGFDHWNQTRQASHCSDWQFQWLQWWRRVLLGRCYWDQRLGHGQHRVLHCHWAAIPEKLCCHRRSRPWPFYESLPGLLGLPLIVFLLESSAFLLGIHRSLRCLDWLNPLLDLPSWRIWPVFCHLLTGWRTIQLDHSWLYPILVFRPLCIPHCRRQVSRLQWHQLLLRLDWDLILHGVLRLQLSFRHLIWKPIYRADHFP